MRTRLAGLSFAIWCLCQGAPARGEVDFNRDVRPILSQHCFKCHGGDEQARKSGLRLDQRKGALAPAKSGARAIVPGEPAQSELLRRIDSADPDEVMPPPSTKRVLSGAQKETLRGWIAEGAEYRDHWAFVVPRRPNVPPSVGSANPVDAFIRQRLPGEGLTPSPEASVETLTRRVSLDLLGLPPSADAPVEAHPNAHERMVDRFLASPRYGERWARRWLDLARYADTNGYEKDRPRTIWPYRDWVIEALNADLPFDRFTVEQLAGDMLPNPTTANLIATGFHRNTMLNEEGGIDPLEFRYHAVVDRVNTTGAAWLGLTVGCAQCHTHKFDPISQREYYQLMAFLNNADEPEIGLPDAKAESAKNEAVRKEAKFWAEVLTGNLAESAGFRAWEKETASKAVDWQVLKPGVMSSSMPILTPLDDGSILASGDITKSDVYELRFDSAEPIIALRLEALPHPSLPRGGPGLTYYEGPIGDFCLSEIQVLQGEQPRPLTGAAHSFANGHFTSQAAIDGNPQTGWMIDGGQGRAHQAVFRFAEPILGSFIVRMIFERHFAPALGRFRLSATSDTKAGQIALPPEVEAALRVAGERSPAQRESVLKAFVELSPALARRREALAETRKSSAKPLTTLVMRERPAGQERATYIHHRGEFLQPKDRVPAAVPAFLPALSKGSSANRLDFARWLVSAENPLASRVAVNRQWQAFFGRGLVRTVEDFGYQGELPTHPELLDWLALEFVEQGWSMKKLHRLIVTSATYRQSSAWQAESRRDPENRWLSRGPRHRLEAEIVRDSALQAARLLSSKMFGPGVFPPQPASVTTEGAYGQLAWKASDGEDRHRRSLYTYVKRTTPFAMAATFDAPSGEACLAKREVSNSPLQALTLMNDTVFLETAQELGREFASRQQAESSKIAELWRRCLGRSPGQAEVSELAEFHRRQMQRFAQAPANAQAFAGPGDGDAAERAAWTATARALLNLDEFVTKN